ncbi:MAG: RHS repeat-associated core domain-containing protein [Fibrobacter sp.]|nr:RHS repeat-associated core domain-containing protein [Fibrobacter sp.]
MKKMVFLALMLFVTSFADYKYVKNDISQNGGIQLGMPSWIDLDETTVNNELINEKTAYSPYNKKTIHLSSSHFFKYMGETYSSLTFWENGVVEFGESSTRGSNAPRIHLFNDLKENGKKTFESFRWMEFVENHEVNKVSTSDSYVVLECRFDDWGIQVSIYHDGEFQIQYWNFVKEINVAEEWMYAYIEDEYRSPKYLFQDNTSSMFLYGDEGLRSGWVAKRMLDSYTVDVEEPEKGRGLVVSMGAGHSDNGVLIAYDFSREHPVVGSFSSVEVEFENVLEKLYCWYFTEANKYSNQYYNQPYGAYDSNYPYVDSQNQTLVLKREDFAKSWQQYGFSGYNDEKVKYVPAVALKFQRIRDAVHHDYDFKIKKVKYNLAQLPSLRFMAKTNYGTFSVINEDGGRVVVEGMSGVADEKNPKIMRYPVWEKKFCSLNIFVSPGYELSEVYYSYYEEPTEQPKIWLYSELQGYDKSRVTKKDSENKFTISNVNTGLYSASAEPLNVFVYVKYKKCSRKQNLVTPYYTKMERFFNFEGDGGSAVSAIYSDGFGGVAQTQRKLVDNQYTVSSEYSNSLGKTTKVPMTFVQTNEDEEFHYVDVACENCVTRANEYFVGPNEYVNPDANGFAFSETNYFNDDEGLIFESAGVSDNSFEMNRQTSRDGYTKVWKMLAKDENDFVDNSLLDDKHLAGIYNKRKDEGGTFVLRIKKSANGVYSQKIFDEKGRNVTSWIYDGIRPLVYYNKYDEFGNLEESGIRGFEQLSTKNRYDAQNRLISTESSDRGKTEYFYDSHGRLRLTRTSQLKEDGKLTYFVLNYNALGKVCSTGVSTNFDFKGNFDQPVPNKNFKKYSRFIYGVLTKDSLTQFGVDENVAESITSMMNGIRPNDESAVVAFDDDGEYTKISIKSYDDLGRVSNQWLLFGLDKFPPIHLSYSYNSSNDVVESSFSEWVDDAWIERSKRKRTYNSDGQLEKIDENGVPQVTYSYALKGNLESNKFYFDETSYLKSSIHKDIYGRVERIEYFNEKDELVYSAENIFNSSINQHADKTSHEWKSIKGYGDEKHENEYTYDYIGRLTSVSGNQPGLYDYDNLGRLKQKAEKNASIEYKYEDDLYRPNEFEVYEVGTEKPSAAKSKLRYDASGNVWLDERNKVVYKNNAFGMPVRIYKLSAIPEKISLADVKKGQNLGTIETEVNIAYDEKGDRIWYSVQNLHDGSGFMKATVPGVGVYTSIRINGIDSKIGLERRELASGGFRQGVDGPVYIPLTDIQGNVRGYASKNGLENAFSYYAYGDVDEFAYNSIDGHERWQSKEFDAEHGKYYFGSRYFDPFLGLWTSPDPAGQFANPYTYGGDPVNFVDPNGEEVVAGVVITAAIVGAVISGGSAWYNCTNYGGGSCTKGVTVGAVSGAVAGAAGAAVGGFAASYAALGTEAALGSVVGGMASSAAGYTSAHLLTDGYKFGNFDGAEIIQSTLEGGAEALIDAGVGYALDATGVNIMGKNGNKILGGAMSSGIMSYLKGDGFWNGFGQGALSSSVSTLMSSSLRVMFDVDPAEYELKDIVDDEGSPNVRDGDIIVFERQKGDFVSTLLAILTGESYTHAALVEDKNKGKAGEKQELVIREATSTGSEHQTGLKDYKGRRFKVVGNNPNYTAYKAGKNGFSLIGGAPTGQYNLFETNCTSQVSRWTGMNYVNNPGVLARRMGFTAYYGY